MTNQELSAKALNLNSLIVEFNHKKTKFNKLVKMSRQIKLGYQEKLEIGYEKNDLRDSICKLESEINTEISWFRNTGRFTALKAFADYIANGSVKSKNSALKNYLNKHNNE